MQTAAEKIETTREAVGIFHDVIQLEEAVGELQSSGFDRAQISLLAGEEAVIEKLGAVYEKTQDAEDDPAAPRTAFVSKGSIAETKTLATGLLVYVGAIAATGAVVASGGTLGPIIAAAAAGGGASGAIGFALTRLLGDKKAKDMQEQLDHGGVVVWVQAPSPTEESKACEILRKHGAADVHVHELPSAR